MSNEAFQQLKLQIQQGKDAGMKQVFEETNRYCVRTLLKKTNCDLADAEDLYMDAVLVFRENMLSGKLTHLSNLKTYLFGICWNLWRDFQRAKAKWAAPESEIERQLWLISGEENGPFESDSAEIMRQRIQLVSQALQQLGDTCRQLLTYVYVEKRSQKEIAQLMGLASANVVKVTRHRCYQQWVRHIDQAK